MNEVYISPTKHVTAIYQLAWSCLGIKEIFDKPLQSEIRSIMAHDNAKPFMDLALKDATVLN